jgi:hypothetical protein
MGASTNATCQPERLENWYAKTWDSVSTLGVELAPRAVSFPTGDRAHRERICRMWRIRVAVAANAAVKKMVWGFGVRAVWLPKKTGIKPSRRFSSY